MASQRKYTLQGGKLRTERLALDNIGWSRTEWKSCFPRSATSSSSSRDRTKYGGIWFIQQTKINRIVMAEKASLQEVDRPSPYSAIFISVRRGRRWRHRPRKHDSYSFYFTVYYLMLTAQKSESPRSWADVNAFAISPTSCISDLSSIFKCFHLVDTGSELRCQSQWYCTLFSWRLTNKWRCSRLPWVWPLLSFNYCENTH